MAVLRVLFLQYNPKTGRYPTARTQRFTLERAGPRQLRIKPHGMSRKELRDLGKGGRLVLPLVGREVFDPQKLGRSLYKIGLGVVAYHVGHSAALDARYDPARDFIFGRAGFPNRLALRNRVEPRPDIEGYLETHAVGTFFSLNLFGLVLLMNLEPSPEITVDPENNPSDQCSYELTDPAEK